MSKMNDSVCKVVRAFMDPCPGIWVAIRHAVEYYAQATRAFFAGIKCRKSIMPFVMNYTKRTIATVNVIINYTQFKKQPQV